MMSIITTTWLIDNRLISIFSSLKFGLKNSCYYSKSFVKICCYHEEFVKFYKIWYNQFWNFRSNVVKQPSKLARSGEWSLRNKGETVLRHLILKSTSFRESFNVIYIYLTRDLTDNRNNWLSFKFSWNNDNQLSNVNIDDIRSCKTNSMTKSYRLWQQIWNNHMIMCVFETKFKRTEYWY